MKKRIIIAAFICLLLYPISASATMYKVCLTRKESNLYQDLYSKIYFRTMVCFEFVFYDDAIYNDSLKEITFSNGST